MAGARTWDVRRSRAAVAVLALLAAGCSTGEDPPAAPGASATPSPAATPTTSDPTASEPPAPRPRPVRIALAGDVHFEGVLADRLGDPATALDGRAHV